MSYIGSQDIIAHTNSTSNPHSVTKTQVGLANVNDLKQNLAASVGPGVSDDAAAGYAVGSQWIDTTADKGYICLDSSNGSAVWQEITVTDHTLLSNIGTKSHATIDSEIDANAATGVANASAIGTAQTDILANASAIVVTDSTLGAHEADDGNPHLVTKAQVGLTNVADLKVNLVATTAPVATDDTGSGYAVGSRWVDVTADEEYVCLDATSTAAVWVQTTGASDWGDIGGTLSNQTDLQSALDAKLTNVVEDTTPQLGGQLDVNGQAIGNGTEELITFVETTSAVNHIEIENNVTSNGYGAVPEIKPAGDDTNIGIAIRPKGDYGQIIMGNEDPIDNRQMLSIRRKLEGDLATHASSNNRTYSAETKLIIYASGINSGTFIGSRSIAAAWDNADLTGTALDGGLIGFETGSIAKSGDGTGLGASVANAVALLAVVRTSGGGYIEEATAIVAYAAKSSGSAITAGINNFTGLKIDVKGNAVINGNKRGIHQVGTGWDNVFEGSVTVAAGFTAGGLVYPTADGTANQVIETDGSGNLSFVTAGGGASALDDLTDVTIATALDTEVITYNASAGVWQNQAAAVAGALGTLTDVSVASPTDADVLTWNASASNWDAQAAGGGGGDNWMAANGGSDFPIAPTADGDGTYPSFAIGNDCSASSGTANASFAMGDGVKISSYRSIGIGQHINITNGQNIVMGMNRNGSTTCSGTSNIVIMSSLTNSISGGSTVYLAPAYNGTMAITSGVIVGNASLKGQLATPHYCTAVGTGVHFFDTEGEVSYPSGDSPDAKGATKIILVSFTSNNTSKTMSHQNETQSADYLRQNVNSLYHYKGTVLGKTAGNVVSAWTVEWTARQNATASTQALVGSATVTLIGQDGGASAWTVTIVMNTTNGRSDINIVGDTTNRVEWVANIDITKVWYD